MSATTDPTELDILFAAATAARGRAYAPYSGYAVGAAIRADDGSVYAGCNVENAAYPVGTCAEAGALAAMIAGGGRVIAQILILGPGPELIVPCGACRQRIREFAREDTLIHLAGPDGVARTCRIDDLLPFAFGPEMLAGAKGRTEDGA